MFLGCLFLTNRRLFTFVVPGKVKEFFESTAQDIWDEIKLFSEKSGCLFLTNRRLIIFVSSDKTRKFFDNMETDCDFNCVDLHVTGNQSKMKGPPPFTGLALTLDIIKV